MKQDNQAVLLDVIERDLNAVKEQLFDNAFSGHKLLVEQSRAIEELSLARLLFATASLGDYRSEELVPVAVGLELLQFAAEKHYRTKAKDEAHRNLTLVTADYYYAQAIILAAGLNKGYVVEHMVKAVADLAEAEAAKQVAGAKAALGDKSISLYRTAVKLGLMMSGGNEDLAEALQDFASSIGYIHQMSANHSKDDNRRVDTEQIERVKESVITSIKALPTTQAQFLEKLISTI